MANETVKLDPERHAITLRGRTRRLQNKAWHVIRMLHRQYPGIVSRGDIIANVWDGNVAVGEKGLSQAIWQLRRELGDSAREPRIIRTIPRVGYQWIQPPVARDATPSTTRRTQPVANATMLATVACVAGFAAGALFVDRDPARGSSFIASKLPATDVYLVDRDVHVIFEDGTVGILKNVNRADVRSPVLSRDGSEIAVAVRENGRCRMLTINLMTREREDFGDCPAA